MNKLNSILSAHSESVCIITSHILNYCINFCFRQLIARHSREFYTISAWDCIDFVVCVLVWLPRCDVVSCLYWCEISSITLFVKLSGFRKINDPMFDSPYLGEMPILIFSTLTRYEEIIHFDWKYHLRVQNTKYHLKVCHSLTNSQVDLSITDIRYSEQPKWHMQPQVIYWHLL